MRTRKGVTVAGGVGSSLHRSVFAVCAQLMPDEVREHMGVATVLSYYAAC